MGKCVEGIDGVLSAGGEEASKYLLSTGTGPCSISTEDLAVAHRRSHGLLGRPVGRFDVSVVEEGENLTSMFGQVILESAIVFLRALVRHQ